jgi:hypothetical protein
MIAAGDSRMSNTIKRDDMPKGMHTSQSCLAVITRGPLQLRQSVAVFSFIATLGLLLFTISRSPSLSQAFGTQLSLTPTKGTEIMKSPCGQSAAEARAMGCHFDIITFCWLPDRCYDAELSAFFDQLSPWEWYLDFNKTKPVSKAEALTEELDGLYVSWGYHIQHCVYMWQKMHRVFLGDGKPAVDGYIGTYMHTKHCGKMLLTRGKNYALTNYNTRIRVKFPDCGIE